MHKLLHLMIAVISIGGLSASAAAFDFQLTMEECKTTLGYLGPTEEPVKTVPGATSVFLCTRASQSITCDVAATDASPMHKGAGAQFSVGFESPPWLYFQSDSGSDYFAVNLTNHRVVMVSRFVDEYIVGSKVCRGAYLTGSEVDVLRSEP